MIYIFLNSRRETFLAERGSQITMKNESLKKHCEKRQDMNCRVRTKNGLLIARWGKERERERDAELRLFH